MSRFTAINLAALPMPAAVEVLSFETLLAELKAELIRIAPELEAVLALESDLVAKVLEAFAYRELLIRADTNDQVRAVHIATATGTDLDNLAALFGVTRLIVTPADPETTPPTPAVMETDAALRLRTQLALDGYSTAGSRASYEFHARTASSQVSDVLVDSPRPGLVRVVVLAATETGLPSPELVATVAAALNAEEVRPLCDTVRVLPAVIVPFQISAELIVQYGPDPALVLKEARAELASYLAEVRGVGRTIRRSAIYAALHRPGVEAVNLVAPAVDLAIEPTEAGHCAAINLTTRVLE